MYNNIKNMKIEHILYNRALEIMGIYVLIDQLESSQ